MILLQQMIVLFFVMVIGWGAGKKGVFDDAFSDKLTWLVVNVANPALALSASVCADGAISGDSLVISCVLAILTYAILMPLSILVARLLKVKESDRSSYELMLVFSNIGFMGYPLIKVMFGSDALLYGTPFMLLYNVFIYTWGVLRLQKGRDGNGGFSLKKIMSPGVIAGVISVIIYLTGFESPLFVENAVDMLSNLAAPLSMMVIGYSFCSISFKELFTDVKLIIFSVLKLLVIPIIGILIVSSFISNTEFLAVFGVMLATPAGSLTAMLARQYADSSETASKGVALTTLLSVVTIPLVFAVCGIG